MYEGLPFLDLDSVNSTECQYKSAVAEVEDNQSSNIETPALRSLREPYEWAGIAAVLLDHHTLSVHFRGSRKQVAPIPAAVEQSRPQVTMGVMRPNIRVHTPLPAHDSLYVVALDPICPFPLLLSLPEQSRRAS